MLLINRDGKKADVSLRSGILQCALCAAALFYGCGCNAGPAAGRQVDPYNDSLAYSGRFVTSDSAGPVAAWTGSSVTIRFTGTGAAARLADRGSRAPGERNYLAVIVDGRPASVLGLAADSTTYPLAADLKDTVHTVTLFKRTEANIGPVQFRGFSLAPGARLLPAPEPPERRIEVVGNSITCGYGNEAAGAKEKFSARTENGYAAYGAVAARLLGAEYRAVCWSGKGIYRNFDGERFDVMPRLYGRVLPADTSSLWDFCGWQPQAVVINLGTNDFARGNPTEEQFGGAFERFVRRLRGIYPEARVFCAVGSMLSDRWPRGRQAKSTAIRYLESMIGRLSADGIDGVYLVDLGGQHVGTEGVGSSHHPSLKTHARMGRTLAACIAEKMSWVKTGQR